ncbi:MAG: hypothetical protein WDO17_02145 [Alphaproteobacteria bacterium]
MASDIFHKIDFIGEDFAHKLDHQLIKLGTDFDRVGDSFLDLIADAQKVNEHKHIAGVKFEDAAIKHDVDTLGVDFIKLGDGFLKLDEAQHKFDDAFLKFADQFIKFTPGTVGNVETDQGSPKLGDDFLKLDTDLKLSGFDTFKLGLDFLKLDHTHTESPNAALQTLSADFHKIDGNLSSLGDDFLKLGVDYKLAQIDSGALKLSEAGALKIDDALHKLGTDDTAIGTDFKALSNDFLKISVDLAPTSEGTQPTESLSLNFAKIVFTSSKDFQQLDSDMHKLDLDLKLLGDDSIKLANLLPAVQAPGSPDDHGHGPSDSLHQILQLVHDFSLL